MANKLDSLDSGSNYQFGDKLQIGKFPRSGFNLSHINNLSFPAKSNGLILPVLTLRTVPSDSFDISVDCLLRVLPQVVPMYSRQRIYIHAFYCRGADLWRGFNVFASKGYSGKRSLVIPTLNANNCPDHDITSDSLLHYLYGLPIGTRASQYYGKVSALPAMMYFKIWRDYFMNKNFYVDDRHILPDDDADFRLNDDGDIISYAAEGLHKDISEWRYRDFSDDRFTSALPSPQRGEQQRLNIDLQGLFKVVAKTGDEEPVDFIKRFSSGPLSTSAISFSDIFGVPGSGDSRFSHYASGSPEHSSNVDIGSYSSRRDYSLFADLSQGSGSFGFTLDDLRRLAIDQTELEKMSHTDGSYREFGLTFFGQVSKTAVDYRPLYFGSTYQPIIFSEVIQTVPSEMTDPETGDTKRSPLGTYGGHGISSNISKDGYVGRINCDDYGYVMLVASIMPDTYYSQGLDKQFTDITQDTLLLPERAKLGMQPILNKELYFTGDDSIDNDLFAYQDIFDEYRYLPNVVRGALADKAQEEFFPYTQSRYFENLPTYSQSFATTKDNVRMDFLTAPNFIPYTAQFGFKIRAVRPLPYRAIPASVI